jgi:hypothetical protein
VDKLYFEGGRVSIDEAADLAERIGFSEILLVRGASGPIVGESRDPPRERVIRAPARQLPAVGESVVVRDWLRRGSSWGDPSRVRSHLSSQVAETEDGRLVLLGREGVEWRRA